MAKVSAVSPLARPLPALAAIKGVQLASVAAGIKYPDRDDLMMMSFAPDTTVAGVFTKSKCPGAPVDWSRAALTQGRASALVVNSGNANVFTGRQGVMACHITASDAARVAQCPATEIFLASTGVIGEALPVDRITAAMPTLYQKLTPHGWESAARAIMTTDTFPKAATRTTKIKGQTVTLQGIAKGSGMIAPDMATMLGFIVTDAALPHNVLQELLQRVVDQSFNAITVDSDSSTSDMVLFFATGQAKNPPIIDAQDDALEDFTQALTALSHELAQMIIRDGEGATKVIAVKVTGAVSHASAKKIALAVGNSPLVKTAIAGEDANWGRIVMAVGKSGEPANRDTLSICMGDQWIARQGALVESYQEERLVEHMRGQEIEIHIDLGLANGHAQIWGCDLTKEYVAINGSYRS